MCTKPVRYCDSARLGIYQRVVALCVPLDLSSRFHFTQGCRGVFGPGSTSALSLCPSLWCALSPSGNCTMRPRAKAVRRTQRKCLQNPATNVDAAFAGARSIAAARTLPEAAQLYGKFAQQQWSAGSAQLNCLSYRSGAAHRLRRPREVNSLREETPDDNDQPTSEREGTRLLFGPP